MVADVQEGGKGRRGRAWVAPVPGTNIAMSFLLRPEIDPSRASMMTLIACDGRPGGDRGCDRDGHEDQVAERCYCK